MAGTQIKIKQSAVLGKVPAAASLTQGELALNTADQKLYSKDGSNTVFEIGGAGAGANEIITTEYTASAGQVNFNATYVLPNDHVNVYYNGMKLVASDYTATSGTNIVLAAGALVNDLVVIEVIKAIPLLNGSEIIEHEFLASAAQTSFTITGGYNILGDTIEVFVNGIKLLASVDFTRTDGTNVVLTTAASLNDEVTVIQIKMIALADVVNSSGSSAIIPAGTTAERDASPLAGYIRWNTTTAALESYNGSAWQSIDTDTTYSIQDGELSEINFTSADHTKLNNIEAGADVTDTTNVTAAGALMDSEVTNLAQVKAFDTTDYATAAQGATADAALPLAGGAMTGAITTTSTFDGRDVSVDGTKLDNIEANATADQTGAEIKAAYEGEADTNEFSDAEKTKLSGIATSANNYIHPTAHSISEITGLQTQLNTIAADAIAMAIALG